MSNLELDSQGVTWIVMNEPSFLGKRQLDEYRRSVALYPGSKVREGKHLVPRLDAGAGAAGTVGVLRVLWRGWALVLSKEDRLDEVNASRGVRPVGGVGAVSPHDQSNQLASLLASNSPLFSRATRLSPSRPFAASQRRST